MSGTGTDTCREEILCALLLGKQHHLNLNQWLVLASINPGYTFLLRSLAAVTWSVVCVPPPPPVLCVELGAVGGAVSKGSGNFRRREEGWWGGGCPFEDLTRSSGPSLLWASCPSQSNLSHILSSWSVHMQWPSNPAMNPQQPWNKFFPFKLWSQWHKINPYVVLSNI